MSKAMIGVSNWSNHLDHLVPICDALQIPIIVDTPQLAEIAAKFYPRVSVRVEGERSDALMDYQVIFTATRVPRSKPRAVGFPRHVRTVHCPHGWSDKFWWNKWMALEDITLIYGDAQLRLFEEHGTAKYLNQYVRVGNHRYQYYRAHQAAFDRLVDAEVFHRLDPDRETILYAPTWNDIDGSSSFFAACAPLVESLPPRYQLVIKLHPLMDFKSRAQTDELVRACGNRDRVVILKGDFPLVFPLLARAAIYLGDRSSVGYDFVAFRRPMFFLKTASQRAHERLETCGTTIEEGDYANMFDIIERGRDVHEKQFRPVQDAVWQDCFEPTASFDAIVRGIAEAVAGDRNDDDGFEVPPELMSELGKQGAHLGLQQRAPWMRLLTWVH
jgi:hypothetical protein